MEIVLNYKVQASKKYIQYDFLREVFQSSRKEDDQDLLLSSFPPLYIYIYIYIDIERERVYTVAGYGISYSVARPSYRTTQTRSVLTGTGASV
jgi:hypothetical protein